MEDEAAAAADTPTVEPASADTQPEAAAPELADGAQAESSRPHTPPTAAVKPLSGRSAASHGSGKSAEELTTAYLDKRRSASSDGRAQLNDATAELPPPTTSGRSTVLGGQPRAPRQSAALPDVRRDPYHMVPVHGATRETNVAGIKQWDRKWYYPGPGTYRLPQDTSRYGNVKAPAYSLTGKESGEFIRHAVKQSAGPGPKYHTAQAPPPPRRGFTFGSERRFYKLPKKFNQFETPGPGRYDGALNRTGDASFTKLTSSPSFGFGSGSYADGPKRYTTTAHEFELLGTFSPGPIYNVYGMGALKFASDAAYSIVEKHRTPAAKHATPGPAYCVRVSHKGTLDIGTSHVITAGAKFTRAPQRLRRDLGMAVPFLSKEYIEVENKCTEGPGPVYSPKLLPVHYPTPSLGGFGHPYRFHEQNELGRMR